MNFRDFPHAFSLLLRSPSLWLVAGFGLLVIISIFPHWSGKSVPEVPVRGVRGGSATLLSRNRRGLAADYCFALRLLCLRNNRLSLACSMFPSGRFIRCTVSAFLFLVAPPCFAQVLCPPSLQWQHTIGGAGDETFSIVQQTRDGGFIAGGYSGSAPSPSKTSPLFGRIDYWVVRFDAMGRVLWDCSFGGSDNDTLAVIQETADGGFILGGSSYSDISGNKTTPVYGYYDFWVVRLGADGTKLWDRTYGGTGNYDLLYTLQETADGGFILGGGSGCAQGDGSKSSPHYGDVDYWIVRIDAQGNQLWDRCFGGRYNDYLYSLQQTLDGGFIVGGFSSSGIWGSKTSPSFGGVSDYWIIRLDANGRELWQRAFGGSGWDILRTICQTSDGGFLLGGDSDSPADGNKSIASHGSRDFWIVRIDANGNKLWEQSYGGTGADWLFSMHPTSDGGFILGGTSGSGIDGNRSAPHNSTLDAWLVRVDGLGNKVWDQAFGTARLNELRSVQQTRDGGFVFAGFSFAGIDPTTRLPVNDSWIVKLSPEPECDEDGDGVPDSRDLCPNTLLGAAVDENGCSIDQLVPCDGEWRNHGEYVRAVKEASRRFLDLGLITEQQRIAILRQAAASDCGKKQKGRE